MSQTLNTILTVNETIWARCIIPSIDQFIKLRRTEIIRSGFDDELLLDQKF